MHILKTIPTFNELTAIKTDLKAILWDLDGTILNSEQIHASTTKESIIQIAADDQLASVLDFEQLEANCLGQTDQFIYQYVNDLGYLKGITLQEFIRIKNIHMKNALDTLNLTGIYSKEIGSLIKESCEQGIRNAVVTSSEKEVAHLILGHLQIHSYFDFVLTREDTKLNKPHPLPYQTACEKLDIAPEHILVFEDSPTGMEAAKQANLFTCQAAWYY